MPNRGGYPPGPVLERIDFEEQAVELAPLLEDGAHLVGHSYGGVISLLIAARYPKRVRSLTVSEPPAFSIACANSTKVSVIRLADGKNLETISCALYPNAPNGNTPNSLALTPDGQMLFVANADANNVAVFNDLPQTE